jgi:hypothetical protein
VGGPKDHVQESCSCRYLSPINPAVDHLADLALWEAELAADPQVVASSLAARLARVPDPRDPRGRRHPLVVILVLAPILASGSSTPV